MAVEGCGLVSKYIIMLFNCIFAVVGIAFSGIGLWLRFSDSSRPLFEIKELDSSTFVIGVTVLIVVGVVMLVVVTFGDLGACNENRSCLQVFSCLVAILAGAEIIIGILAYTYSDLVAERIKEFYISLYGVYVATSDPALAVALTFLHSWFHCCGLTGIFVEQMQNICPEPENFFGAFKMQACPSTIASVLDSKAPIMVGTFIGTGALLIIVLVCSIILLKHIQRNQNDINAYYSKVY